MRSKLMIITPIYYGDASGASVYYQLLSKSLSNNGIEVHVVSEQIETSSSNYFPLFPRRSGENKRGALDYLNYLIQNILYINLFKIIKKVKPTTVIVHTSFFNKPGLFGLIFRLLKVRFQNINWIADARDRLIGPQGAAHLLHFDHIIACSENVQKHINKYTANHIRPTLIPIIQSDVSDIQLKNKPIINEKRIPDDYILYVGAIKEEKHVDLLIKTYINHIQPQMPTTKLVLAGLIKSNNRALREMLYDKNICYVGNVTNNQTLNLISNARLCVNISPCEGMPRFSLESLSMSRPTVLPPNVPEFERYCPNQVSRSTDSVELSKLIINNLLTPERNNYPIAQHYEENVINKYLELIQS